MIAGKPCPRCAAAPCPIVRDARRSVTIDWTAVTMDDPEVAELFKDPCPCGCHDKEAK